MGFFNDFFHYTEQIPCFIKKITDLRECMIKLRTEFGIRMFSSSVLFIYDEEDPTKFDCRILDFAKTYLDIEEIAPQHNEKVEDCEDMIVPALTHIIEMLGNVLNKC